MKRAQKPYPFNLLDKCFEKKYAYEDGEDIYSYVPYVEEALNMFEDKFTYKRDADILRKRFAKNMKYKDIAAFYGVCVTRIRECELRGCRQLRWYLRKIKWQKDEAEK